MTVLGKASSNLPDSHGPRDTWSHGLDERQSQAGNDMSREEEDTVRIRYQAPTSENTAGLEELLCAVLKCKVCELAIAV
jgi:hypothetical protein